MLIINSLDIGPGVTLSLLLFLEWTLRLKRIRCRVEFLNYHHLRYFWVVAKEGGLRKAAEKLHVSQPTISAQIAALEGTLDEKLFQRGGRALALTETGHRVLGYAEEIFSLGQELLDAARQRPGWSSARGRWRCGMSREGNRTFSAYRNIDSSVI